MGEKSEKRREFRRDLRTIGIAALVFAALQFGPAIGHGVHHALFAHNAGKLNHYPHKALRSMPLLIQGAATNGNASSGPSGVTFPSTGSGTMTLGFVVPPDHKAGTPVYADIVYGEGSSGTCSWRAFADGLEGPDGGTFYNGGWYVTSSSYSGTIGIPAGESDAFKRTFRWPFRSQPGQVIQFELGRAGDHAADTCNAITVYGVRIRY